MAEGGSQSTGAIPISASSSQRIDPISGADQTITAPVTSNAGGIAVGNLGAEILLATGAVNNGGFIEQAPNRLQGVFGTPSAFSASGTTSLSVGTLLGIGAVLLAGFVLLRRRG